jgi:Terminase large subunit, T4likevirus-type, N-terminal
VFALARNPAANAVPIQAPADIAIYGGAAGGGKTFAELLEPLRHVSNKDFGAVIFRRTTLQITNKGALWDESLKLYPLLGAKPNQGDLYWTLQLMFKTGRRGF